MSQPERLHFEPREYSDPETGRRIKQITHGDAFCYPLYYFIPTTTAEGDVVMFHRWADDEIQIYRLNVASGQARRLTNASTPDAAWRPWLYRPTSGVRDQYSAFNVVTRELIYFDRNTLRGVHIDSLEDRLIYELADDRVPCGLTGVSPDGTHFVFPHADRAWWESHRAVGPPRASALGTVVELIELKSGAARKILSINGWITHANFFDDTRILLSHPPTENGILVADINSNWYAHIRTQSGPSPIEQTSHYQVTDQGIAYEMRNTLGLCDAYSFACQEYSIVDFPVTHIGRDPQARLWFFDSKIFDPQTGDHTGPRCICFMPELKLDTPNKPILLTSGPRTFGVGQPEHAHPQLMPDRKNILCVAGDERSQSNHLHLIDVADLEDTRREVRA